MGHMANRKCSPCKGSRPMRLRRPQPAWKDGQAGGGGPGSPLSTGGMR
jgi:hypothetical protein